MLINMRINLIVLMYVFLCSSFCVAGQYYKFVDQNGVISFTDDISKIPKDQRSAIEVNKTIKKDQAINKSDSTNTNTSDEDKLNKTNDNNQQATSQNLDKELKELNKIKEELDKEAEDINNVGIKLIEQNKNLKDNKSIETYNLKIDKLNQRTKTYQEKQVEYLKRANEYNAKVGKEPVKQ